MQEPIHELIRMVRIFSTPWEEKSAALKKLHEDFHKKKRQLDVAIRRLNIIDAMVWMMYLWAVYMFLWMVTTVQ